MEFGCHWSYSTSASSGFGEHWSSTTSDTRYSQSKLALILATTMHFREFLQSRPMLLDAGMGTRLIERGFGCLAVPIQVSGTWISLTSFGRFMQLDRDAGSDALFTNSFGVHLRQAGSVVEEINVRVRRIWHAR